MTWTWCMLFSALAAIVIAGIARAATPVDPTVQLKNTQDL